MKVYISSRMTGLPDLNFPEFHRVQALLELWGYEVANPALINPDPATPYEVCMERDLEELAKCDAIVMFGDWKNSPGAQRELAEAKRLGLKLGELYVRRRDGVETLMWWQGGEK